MEVPVDSVVLARAWRVHYANEKPSELRQHDNTDAIEEARLLGQAYASLRVTKTIERAPLESRFATYEHLVSWVDAVAKELLSKRAPEGGRVPLPSTSATSAAVPQKRKQVARPLQAWGLGATQELWLAVNECSSQLDLGRLAGTMVASLGLQLASCGAGSLENEDPSTVDAVLELLRQLPVPEASCAEVVVAAQHRSLARVLGAVLRLQAPDASESMRDDQATSGVGVAAGMGGGVDERGVLPLQRSFRRCMLQEMDGIRVPVAVFHEHTLVHTFHLSRGAAFAEARGVSSVVSGGFLFTLSGSSNEVTKWGTGRQGTVRGHKYISSTFSPRRDAMWSSSCLLSWQGSLYRVELGLLPDWKPYQLVTHMCQLTLNDSELSLALPVVQSSAEECQVVLRVLRHRDCLLRFRAVVSRGDRPSVMVLDTIHQQGDALELLSSVTLCAEHWGEVNAVKAAVLAANGHDGATLRACLAPFDAIGVVSLSDRELGILKPAWSSDSGTVVVYTLDIRTGTALHSGPGVCEPRDILAKANFQAKTPAPEDFPGYVHRAGLVVCGELTDYVVLAGNQ